MRVYGGFSSVGSGVYSQCTPAQTLSVNLLATTSIMRMNERMRMQMFNVQSKTDRKPV